MKISTLSLVVGDGRCNASCPYCISRMTGKEEVERTVQNADYDPVRFHKACMLAEKTGCTTALITGKGEPTLYPGTILNYTVMAYREFHIPIIELQTNGRLLHQSNYWSWLSSWKKAGLDRIAVSVVHYDDAINNKFMFGGRAYSDLGHLMKIIKSEGFSRRITVTLVKGGIDTPKKVYNMIAWAAITGVEQLSFGWLANPDPESITETHQWVKEHDFSDRQKIDIRNEIEERGVKLLDLGDWGEVFDIEGVSVCLRKCLQEPGAGGYGEIRQLIYYPSGRITYSWTQKGAILL